MAVEIQVLSGSLQGKCLRFDGDRISIGDDEHADVGFNAELEPGSRGKTAVLTLDDEAGWRLTNEGAGVWLINQTPVAAGYSHRLRSDDLVRVSELGPEFYFRLVAGPHGFAIPASVEPEVTVPFAKVAMREPQAIAPAMAKPQAAAANQRTMMAQPRAELPAAGLERSAGLFEDRDLIDKVVLEGELNAPSPARAQNNEHPRPITGGTVMDEQLSTDRQESGAASPATRMERDLTATLARPGAADVQNAAVSSASTADSKSPAEEPKAKRRRKRREASTLSRVIGVIISGLLGLACAYGLACWVGGIQNDVFHIFHR